MIKKSELKGKKVAFIQKKNDILKNGTVTRISGKTLTVKNIVKVNGQTFVWGRQCINPETHTILGVYYRNKLVEIDWSRGA